MTTNSTSTLAAPPPPRKQYIPQLKISQTSNGMIQIDFKNISQLWQVNRNPKHWTFKIECINYFSLINSIFTKNELKQFSAFTLLNMKHPGTIWLKMPLYIKSYNLGFKIHGINKTEIYDQSLLTKFTVESSLIKIRKFNVAEKVLFKIENEVYACDGQIVKELENDRYLITCLNTYGKYVKGENEIIHSSFIFPDKIYLDFICDFTNRMSIDCKLLLHISTNESMYHLMFKCLHEFYEQHSLEYYVWKEVRNVDHYWIGKWFAVHIMCYVIAESAMENYGFDIKCMMNDKHRYMKICESGPRVIQNRIRAIRNCGFGGSDKRNIYMDPRGHWSCDICSVEIHEFDWMAMCDGPLNDIHGICLQCAFNAVEQYSQLLELLSMHLLEYLNYDCVDEIVSFLVARIMVKDSL